MADRPSPLATTRQNAVRRLWGLPLRAHIAALAVVLLGLVPLVGTSSSFLSDEGAAVIEGRSLASGRGWIVPPPLPALDPGGRQYPLVNAERGPRGFAPLAKHPAYSLLVAGADRLGGVSAMVLLSVLGTVLAAGLAGLLAVRLDPVVAPATVWAVGVASPLLFDSFLVMGHTLGAAAATGATLCAVIAIRHRRAGMALAVAPCVAAAVLLRSEALLFAVSLAIAAVVAAVVAVRPGSSVAVRARSSVPGRPAGPVGPAVLVAVAAVTGAAAAHVLEAAWVARIVGGGVAGGLAVPAPIAAHGFLQGRLDGLVITWLLPDYRTSQPVSVLLLLTMAGLALAALASRLPGGARARVLVPSGMAAIAATGALVSAPGTVVPGVLMAFPLLVAGLFVLRRSAFDDVAVVLLGATAAVFAVAVLATQYPSGGTGEWGGRYFALAVPVIVPVLLMALRRQGRMVEPIVRRGALGAMLVCTGALGVMAVSSLRASHRSWDRFVGTVAEAEDVAGPGRPVVTTWSAAPRFAWPIVDRSPWLLAEPGDLGDLRASLAHAGFDRFVFVTVDLDADRPVLAGLEVVWDRAVAGRRHILVVRESGGST